MECTLHVTFDCPTENLRPETVADMVTGYIGRGLGIQVLSAEVDLPELVVLGGPEYGPDVTDSTF
jgi:hypothetical protein